MQYSNRLRLLYFPIVYFYRNNMEHPHEFVSFVDFSRKSINDGSKVHYFIINTIFRMYSK